MRKGWILALAIGALSACSTGNPPSTLVPTLVTGTPKTETFTGTVAVRGVNVHTFSITVSGDLMVTLTAASPPANVVMGMGIGSPSGSDCVANGAREFFHINRVAWADAILPTTRRHNCIHILSFSPQEQV